MGGAGGPGGGMKTFPSVEPTSDLYYKYIKQLQLMIGSDDHNDHDACTVHIVNDASRSVIDDSRGTFQIVASHL